MSSQGKFKVEKKDPLRAFLPIIGLIVIVIAGAVGWFSAPFLLEFGGDYIPSEVTSAVDADTLRILVSVAIFFIIVAIFSMVYAAFAPKPDKLVSEGALKQERIAIEQERKRTKARRRKMKARMKEGTEKLDDI